MRFFLCNIRSTIVDESKTFPLQIFYYLYVYPGVSIPDITHIVVTTRISYRLHMERESGQHKFLLGHD